VPESTTDTWGQPSQTGSQIINPNASDGGFYFSIRPLQGNEMLNVRQIWATATHIITARWLGSVIPKSNDNPNGYFVPSMKLIGVNDGAVYNIVFADNPELRNRQWVLTVEQKIGAVS
jgi:hypothetical protein